VSAVADWIRAAAPHSGRPWSGYGMSRYGAFRYAAAHGGPGHGDPAAAVLIAVEPAPVGPLVWFTRRSAGLRAHAGEVCFPGGRAEPGDRGPRDTALREAFEETRLPAGGVLACALLPPYRTSSGYFVVPVAALLAPGVRPYGGTPEVDAVFAAPLASLRRAFAAAPVPTPPARAPAVTWAGRQIRGATAAMFLSLFSEWETVAEWETQ
jgi:8-oxo-dGTP pyrophosphatase MutT (NUDIX family)